MKQMLSIIAISSIIIQNLLGMTAFQSFPGVNATCIAVDTQNRIIIGGSQDPKTGSSLFRYTPTGTIETIYDPFPGEQINAIAINPLDEIIAVGRKGAVVQYDQNGKLFRTYNSFPGSLATSISYFIFGFFAVVGAQGKVVFYQDISPLSVNNFPAAGPSFSTAMPFPGELATSCVSIEGFGEFLTVGGANGKIITYLVGVDAGTRTINGVIANRPPDFAGQLVQALVQTQSARYIAVGKQSVISEYNLTPGRFLQNFTPFPGISATDIILGLEGSPIVVGLEGKVIKYNASGTINRVYPTFPSAFPQSAAISRANQPIVVGKQSQVVQYENTFFGLIPFSIDTPTSGQVFPRNASIAVSGSCLPISNIYIFFDNTFIGGSAPLFGPFYFLSFDAIQPGNHTITVVGYYQPGKINYGKQTVNITITP